MSPLSPPPTPIPKYLYRYMAFPKDGDYDKDAKLKRMESLFVESKVFLVCPHWFNDPFDCKSALSKEGMTLQYVQKLADYGAKQKKGLSQKQRLIRSVAWMKTWRNTPKVFEQLFEETGKIAAETSNHTGMLSVSVAHDNILMWSHYGNGHQGFCIQFKASCFPMAQERLHEIIYKKQYPCMTEFLDAQQNEDINTQLQLIFTRKSPKWQYEEEWRYIHFYPKGIEQIKTQPVEFPESAFSAVIFGCEMKNENKEMVKGWISKRKTPMTICQAVRSKTQYSVEIGGLPQP